MRLLTLIAIIVFVSGCSTQPTQKESDMYTAISSGNPKSVEVLLNSGTDINIKISNIGNLTPLGVAAYLDKYPVAKYLIDHGANVNAKSDGFTPLHVAALHRHKDIVELLINSGADVNAQGNNGMTPLHKSLEAYVFNKRGQQKDPSQTRDVADILGLLIKHGADVNAQWQGGTRPIHMAAMSGEQTLLKVLIDNGSQVSPKGVDQVTPLYLATVAESPEAAELLLDRGADINAMTASGYTPLMRAAHQGDDDIVELLVNHGANIDSEDKQGNTPLFMTLKTLEMDYTVKSTTPGAILVRNSMSAHEIKMAQNELPTYKGKWSQTALILINHDANANFMKNNETPLGIASIIGDKSIVNALLSHGASPNPPTNKVVESYLHAAIAEGHNDVAAILIEHGADVNGRNVSKRTPLHFLAIYSHDAKLAQLLIDHGTDINAVDKDNKTALSLAVKNGNNEIISLLKEKGAR